MDIRVTIERLRYRLQDFTPAQRRKALFAAGVTVVLLTGVLVVYWPRTNPAEAEARRPIQAETPEGVNPASYADLSQLRLRPLEELRAELTRREEDLARIRRDGRRDLIAAAEQSVERVRQVISELGSHR